MIKPVAQPKKAAVKGKGFACWATQLHAHKVTCIVSPMPEVSVPAPPVASPSEAMCPSLFEDAALLGEEGPESQGEGAPEALGEWYWTLLLLSD